MTKEEAITNLNMISIAFVDPVTREQRKLINDTFEMAIQALSQEPCDDAISRKLAICAIKNLYPDIPRVDFNGAKRKWADKYAQYIECERLIEQLPSVTQKSGKWIKDAYVAAPYVCSECGYFYNLKHRNYCPNCGAKMESEEEK